ncbi:hypothetical protein BV97_03644 [Novosphingobium resinovorum]|uniref:Transposase n=1 Tax=Novosphingobium resinovorum TaxID=158500 RepID=A0A031JTL6_9SPHN|nr:DUF2274 domain-containing protein [Novosphingobium resinovorum]EZP80229.1 hypothetical protein BV97_03644 [Novosphingobium resinovorum]
MSILKLPKLRETTPVKLSISFQPDLYQSLLEYAGVYAQVYGSEIKIADLVQLMLATFLESDREFKRIKKLL